MTSPAIEQAAKSTRTEAEVRANRRYRIRRCNGNKLAWCLIALRADGTEIESHGGFKTALSIDALLSSPITPSPRSGDKLEVVL